MVKRQCVWQRSEIISPFSSGSQCLQMSWGRRWLLQDFMNSGRWKPLELVLLVCVLSVVWYDFISFSHLQDMFWIPWSIFRLSQSPSGPVYPASYGPEPVSHQIVSAFEDTLFRDQICILYWYWTVTNASWKLVEQFQV